MKKADVSELIANCGKFSSTATEFLKKVPTHRREETPGIIVMAPSVYWGHLDESLQIEQARAVAEWRKLQVKVTEASKQLPKGQQASITEIATGVSAWLELEDGNWALSEQGEVNAGAVADLLTDLQKKLAIVEAIL